MSRELKVKAWLKDAKCFAEVRHISFFEGNTVIKIYDQPMSEEIWFDLEELELVQYTGLKDKNGKTYCQDDLIKYNNRIHRLIKGTYMFELTGFYEAYQDNPTDFFAEGAYREGEIVGNIYENPELLEEITK